MSSKACNLSRVQIPGVAFGSLRAHSTELLYNTGGYKLIDATEEDDLFIKWARSGNSLSGVVYALYNRYLQKQEEYKPIPESYRFYHKDEYNLKGIKKKKR